MLTLGKIGEGLVSGTMIIIFLHDCITDRQVLCGCMISAVSLAVSIVTVAVLSADTCRCNTQVGGGGL